MADESGRTPGATRLGPSAKRAIVFASSLGAWLALASTASADDDETSRATLRGLPGVHVVVESLVPRAESAGYHRQAYQQMLEEQLDGGGIPVLSVEKNAGDQFVLVVTVTVSITSNSEGLVHPYSVLMELRQPVTLATSGESTLATTWWTSSTGIGGAEWVNRSVTSMTSAFIDAWKSVN